MESGHGQRGRAAVIAVAIVAVAAIVSLSLRSFVAGAGVDEARVTIESLSTATSTASATPSRTPTATLTATPTQTPALTPPPPSAVTPPLSTAQQPVASSAHAAGVRLWSNGDSTSYFMSVALAQMMLERGAAATQPAPEYKVSSGLLNPGYFDWPAYIAAEMAARQPNVVVFMIGANDAHPGMPLDLYRQRVGALMDQLQAPGRRVVWVGQPNMGRADLAAAIPAMNRIFAEEAASRPWVTYVDVWALTSDANGNYAQYLPDEHGVLRAIRANDGVHFTPEGGRRLAMAVLWAYFDNP